MLILPLSHCFIYWTTRAMSPGHLLQVLPLPSPRALKLEILPGEEERGGGSDPVHMALAAFTCLNIPSGQFSCQEKWE